MKKVSSYGFAGGQQVAMRSDNHSGVGQIRQKFFSLIDLHTRSFVTPF
jgi:hypothetical protein